MRCRVIRILDRAEIGWMVYVFVKEQSRVEHWQTLGLKLVS